MRDHDRTPPSGRSTDPWGQGVPRRIHGISRSREAFRQARLRLRAVSHACHSSRPEPFLSGSPRPVRCPGRCCRTRVRIHGRRFSLGAILSLTARSGEAFRQARSHPCANSQTGHSSRPERSLPGPPRPVRCPGRCCRGRVRMHVRWFSREHSFSKDWFPRSTSRWLARPPRVRGGAVKPPPSPRSRPRPAGSGPGGSHGAPVLTAPARIVPP